MRDATPGVRPETNEERMPDKANAETAHPANPAAAETAAAPGAHGPADAHADPDGDAPDDAHDDAREDAHAAAHDDSRDAGSDDVSQAGNTGAPHDLRDSRYDSAMRRALELAANGPATGVNPRVGCVILDPNGQIIAEGWHRGAGTPHAEVDALSRLREGDARGATAVVTLEPCNHTGRTGPCAVALVEAGVVRVVYATSDPGAHSSGGAERLRAAGVEVEAGVLAEEATAFLGDWLTAARLGRPYVTVKWASSLDGRAAAADGTSQWITGPAARTDVHRRRAAADAIIVGTGTVLADDPALTARGTDGTLLPAQPIPVVIGTRPIPGDAALRSHPHQPLFFGQRAEVAAGAETSASRDTTPTGHHAEALVDLQCVLKDLHGRGIRRAFIEGGPTLASAFVSAGLVDEYLIYLAPTLLGGGPLALGDIGVGTIDAQRRLTIESIEQLGDDVLVVAHPRAQTPHTPPTIADLD
jgi:diaminohydroxyphosphoribosylaminopyrimidine deaminase / 5-amino-6-(5-phosphoribosylamino)uracil reductase